MIDQQLVRLRTHRRNIQRYRNLLQTSLTDLERQFVQKRLTKSNQIWRALPTPFPMTFAGQGRAGPVWPSNGRCPGAPTETAPERGLA